MFESFSPSLGRAQTATRILPGKWSELFESWHESVARRNEVVANLGRAGLRVQRIRGTDRRRHRPDARADILVSQRLLQPDSSLRRRID
jgi:hypothetical protein